MFGMASVHFALMLIVWLFVLRTASNLLANTVIGTPLAYIVG